MITLITKMITYEPHIKFRISAVVLENITTFVVIALFRSMYSARTLLINRK